MEKSTQTIFATALGAVLLAIGILGFFVQPLFGIFQVNTTQNFIHLISGALSICAGAWGSQLISRWCNRIIGGVYTCIALLGFSTVLASTVLVLNPIGNALHALIGIFALIVGFGKNE